MKIDLSGSSPEPIVTTPANSQDAASASRARLAGEDTTSLSYDHANIGSLTSQAMSTADVRQEKVDALRQAIRGGQYKVEPDKVADAILQESSKPSSAR